MRHHTDLKETAASRAVKKYHRFEFSAEPSTGTYSVVTALASTDTHLVNNYEWRDLALVSTVQISRHPFVGCAWFDLTLLQP
jgi:lipopolysaccharide transport system ATP-binding protein